MFSRSRKNHDKEKTKENRCLRIAIAHHPLLSPHSRCVHSKCVHSNTRIVILVILSLLLSTIQASRGFTFTAAPPRSFDKGNKIKRTSNSLHMSTHHHLTDEPPSIQSLVEEAKALYQSTYANNDCHEKQTNNKNDGDDALLCTVAPGRVNLIGEHTDYTQGFVFPMAIEYSTVCVGKGCIHASLASASSSSSSSAATSKCQVISSNQKIDAATGKRQVISFDCTMDMKPLPFSSRHSWTNYVAGVVQRYMEDVLNTNKDCHLQYSISFQIAIAGNVPLGSGLSSSAALEVAIATFIERLLKSYIHDHNDLNIHMTGTVKDKALICQKAENIFCNSPCGIMDQYVSAAGQAGTALLIDCRSLEYENVPLGQADTNTNTHTNTNTNTNINTTKRKKTPLSTSEEEKKSCDDVEVENDELSSHYHQQHHSKPVFVVCNSCVTHSIGGGEYPKRVAQCTKATESLIEVHGERIQSLRDASLDDVEMVKDCVDELIYRRARHVVTENERTQRAKVALMNGDWKQVGQLMNQSHDSMKNDYEVSCDEIDILVDLAQSHPGVYGSRLTGGGFGGCTVTLVEKSHVESLCEHMKKEYKSKTGKDCFCFETEPGNGAREIILSS